MADPHTRDASWETDLIWHYFHDVATRASPISSHRKFFANQDPGGELSDRHRVYEMLVDEDIHTHPELKPTTEESMENYKKSKLPWNQNNGGFLKAVNDEYWCGSLIKIVFIRYMGWKNIEPEPARFGNNVAKAAEWTIKKLENKIPVRASLGGRHYVGIVGHRSVGADRSITEFLCIDPWAYGTDGKNQGTTYAGKRTAFLGIAKRSASSWTYGDKIVRWVEIPP
jgi:hypothetical protein